MIVAPAARAAAIAAWVFSIIEVASITSATAPCREPPSLVKSFWNSMSTRAAFDASMGILLGDGPAVWAPGWAPAGWAPALSR